MQKISNGRKDKRVSLNSLTFFTNRNMNIPKQELEQRLSKIKNRIHSNHPNLQGFFIFSRINIYYFAGTLANGVLYIPLAGKPFLFVRKGLERAKEECPFAQIYSYKSYSEIEKICADCGEKFSETALCGMETAGLTFQLATLFFSRIKALSEQNFVSIDNEIKYVQSIKSAFEQEKMREAGKRQALVLEEILPFYLQKAMHGKFPRTPGLLEQYNAELLKTYPQNTSCSEKNIAKLCIELYTELGHGFMSRMSAHGEEAFYGHIACGNNLNKAHYYNGAMGFDGVHPLLPCLGSDKIWEKGEPLCVDMLFNYEGYFTDKTQCFFYGSEKDLPDTAKKAYECCNAVQDLVLQQLKAGTIPEEIWFQALKIVEQFDFTENFMGYKQNSVPFLGHGIGLTVDQFPVIAKGFKDPLENGMFIACEPKIGIPGFGMIGIENTFELVDNMVKNITSSQDGIIFLD